MLEKRGQSDFRISGQNYDPGAETEVTVSGSFRRRCKDTTVKTKVRLDSRFVRKKFLIDGK